MKKLLPNTISTFSHSSRKTIQSLIGEMKADKVDINSLISKMSSLKNSAEYNYPSISPLSTLDAEAFVDIFRDASIKIIRFFNAANAMSIMLSSMMDVMFDQIEKNEIELDQIEAFIENYEFLSGKDDTFNYNYIEKFSNDLDNYRYDDPTLSFKDKDGSNITMQDMGIVDSGTGYFKFGNFIDDINFDRNINKTNFKLTSNCQSYITTESSIYNLFNDSKQDSWTVTVKSPSILNSGISDYENYLYNEALSLRGAKFAVEIPLNVAIEMNSIKISPNESNGLQLVQVVIFSGNSTNSNNNRNNSSVFQQKILNKPIIINSTIEVTFEKRFVQKVILIFNQANYIRTSTKPIKSELNSKLLDAVLKENTKNNYSYFSKFQDIVYWFFTMRSSIKGITTTRQSIDNYYSCSVPDNLDNIIPRKYTTIDSGVNLNIEDIGHLNRMSVLSRLAYGLLSSYTGNEDLYDSSVFIDSRGGNRNTVSFDSSGIVPSKNSEIYSNNLKSNIKPNIYITSKEDIIKDIEVKEQLNMYEYAFSLRSIHFCKTTQQSNKAVFVSKKIATNNQPVGIKAKVIESTKVENLEASAYDISSLFSYELSVSNKDIPTNDLDWLPISNWSDEAIDSEVLFFDIEKKARLRHWAKNNTIIIYKNGFVLDAKNYRYNNVDNTIQVLQGDIDPDAIYCAKYDLDFVGKSPDYIDLSNATTLASIVKPYSDKYGRGQSFTNTSQNNSVRLNYTPYINQAYISSSTYSPIVGTNFSSSNINYSPVKVRLSNGTFAVNLTNYTNLNYSVNLNLVPNVAFKHVGNEIIFNTPLNEKFEVYYDYIPNNLRFKLVIRKNIPNITSDYGIDSVIFKMKSINYDPFFDKITRIRLNN